VRVFVFKTEIRFYEQDGWNSNILSCYITRGEMGSHGCDSTEAKKYWFMKNNSAMDTDRMFIDKTISEVVRVDCDDSLTDVEILRSRSCIL